MGSGFDLANLHQKIIANRNDIKITNNKLQMTNKSQYTINNG